MFNYQIVVEYLGTNFVGWQIQKNGQSIQEVIQKVLKKVLKTKIKINGSGRTDAGVHANGQSANFITNNEIKNRLEQLRAIENGIKINVGLAKFCPIGVDTIEDYLALKKKLEYNS